MSADYGFDRKNTLRQTAIWMRVERLSTNPMTLQARSMVPKL